MTLAFVLLATITLALIAALAVALWLDRPGWLPGPDAAWLAQLGAEHGEEEQIAERRFRLAGLLGRQKLARIGRRPRP